MSERRASESPVPPGGVGVTERNATSLVTAAAAGDESAWAELVRRYTPLVYSVIRSHDLSGADASDVNQTVWLRLVEHLGRVRDPQALAAWLATTARRECYRLSRLARRTQLVDPYDDTLDAHHGFSPVPDATGPGEELLRAERRQALREGFAQLPPRCQELLSLLTADPPP
ncbi:sigma-70 family RNA polymerase sigma factor, partial [Micromonospora sp. KC606]|uniref:RNA polymerase sigma factor n=1 Tax=Micromonospora sp. KC606 TaxID=2530379 RepID=UPI00104BE5F1